MKVPQIIRLAMALLALAASLWAAPVTQSLVNEDKTLKFSLILEDSRLSYEITHITIGGIETVVVERSPLGISRKDAAFVEGLQSVSAFPVETIEDAYTLISGKRREVRYRAVQQVFNFENAAKQPLQIIVRAEADGVAFRYAFPSGPDGDLLVTGESTGFKMPEEGRVWMAPYERVATWAPSYEMEYKNGIPIGTDAGAEFAGWAMPALFNVRNRWVLVTEALLDGTCYASHLESKAEKGLYRLRLPEDNETYGVAEKEAVIRTPWQSPWRVFVVGSTPATIVETAFITNLNPPSIIKDTSWIKPGRVSWSWWSDMSSPSDYNRLVPFVDLASDLNWEYSTVDLGWPWMVNGNIQQLIEYAEKKKVGLLLWYNSGGKHNQVPDAGPRDCFNTAEDCEKEMAKLESWGVKGVKVDFFQSDKQYVINQYLNILKAGARHKIMVDFHGATIPRGWARTYPNLMTSEGVRGAEQYWDSGFAERAHTIHTIYTFTRNVIGSMDYTPMVIGGAAHLQWPKTTNAHELATTVAFESGLQHFCASVAALRVQPPYVQDFLKFLPVAWDETRYIAGEPGKLSVLARRKGEQWYLSALSGLNEAQTVTASLAFLGRGHFSAGIIGDGESQKTYTQRNDTVSGDETLTLTLAGRGGSVARFVPLK